MAKESKIQPIANWRTKANGHLTKDAEGDDKTDYARWRLHDNDGRLTWRYLETDEENEKWPQTFYDKYNLGLPTVSEFCTYLRINTLTLVRVPRSCQKRRLL